MLSLDLHVMYEPYFSGTQVNLLTSTSSSVFQNYTSHFVKYMILLDVALDQSCNMYVNNYTRDLQHV